MLVVLSITSALLPLAFLACPVGMGAMMFFMMRGNRGQSSDGHSSSDADRRSIAELKAEHARLAEEIERLEQPSRPAEPAER